MGGRLFIAVLNDWNDDPRFASVSLAQHAGVTAAVAEGLPLSAVLAQEQIDEKTWAEADRAWKSALVEAPDLQLRYLHRRCQAEDCLARRIEPLGEDAAAWAGLLGALATAADPASVVAGLGLKMTDIARLGRAWRSKAAADPRVVDQLTKLAGKTLAPTLVRAAAITLNSFPWTPPSPSPSLSTEASARQTNTGDARAQFSRRRGGRLPIEDELDLFSAVMALSQAPASGGDGPRGEALFREALALCGVSERTFTPVVSAWYQQFAGDPDLRAAHMVVLMDHRGALQQLLAGAKGVLSDAP